MHQELLATEDPRPTRCLSMLEGHVVGRGLTQPGREMARAFFRKGLRHIERDIGAAFRAAGRAELESLGGKARGIEMRRVTAGARNSTPFFAKVKPRSAAVRTLPGTIHRTCG